jgi:hypothetical protein
MRLIIYPGMWSRGPEIYLVYFGGLPERADQKPAQHTIDTTVAESRTGRKKGPKNSDPPSCVPGYTDILPTLVSRHSLDILRAHSFHK